MTRLKRMANAQFPENIIKQLKEHYDDNKISMMSNNEAFNALLTIEGICGYDYKIKSWIEQIYKVKLD